MVQTTQFDSVEYEAQWLTSMSRQVRGRYSKVKSKIGMRGKEVDSATTKEDDKDKSKTNKKKKKKKRISRKKLKKRM